MDIRKVINKQRQSRRYRVRARVRGNAERPRMSIHRTLKGFACQVIDDMAGKTLVSATTRDKDLKGQFAYGGNCEAAAKLGKIVADRAIKAGIKTVALDRGHCKYHGRVAAFANAAREAGLEF